MFGILDVVGSGILVEGTGDILPILLIPLDILLMLLDMLEILLRLTFGLAAAIPIFIPPTPGNPLIPDILLLNILLLLFNTKLGVGEPLLGGKLFVLMPA